MVRAEQRYAASAMTATDKLRQAVEDLSELEAEATLAYIAQRRERDPVIEAFENAPLDDEPVTDEEERALEESREAHRRGETYTAEQIRQELGL
jgi:hypothetical protein